MTEVPAPNRNASGEARVDGMLGLQVLAAGSWLNTNQIKNTVSKISAVNRAIEDRLASIESINTENNEIHRRSLAEQRRQTLKLESMEQLALHQAQKTHLQDEAREAIFQAEQLVQALDRHPNPLERYIAAKDLYRTLDFPTKNLSSIEDKRALSDARGHIERTATAALESFDEEMWQDLQRINDLATKRLALVSLSKLKEPKILAAKNSLDPIYRRIVRTADLWAYFGFSIALIVGFAVFGPEDTRDLPGWVQGFVLLPSFLALFFVPTYIAIRSSMRRIKYARLSKADRVKWELEKQLYGELLEKESSDLMEERRKAEAEHKLAQKKAVGSAKMSKEEAAEVEAAWEGLKRKYPNIEVTNN